MRFCNRFLYIVSLVKNHIDGLLCKGGEAFQKQETMRARIQKLRGVTISKRTFERAIWYLKKFCNLMVQQMGSFRRSATYIFSIPPEPTQQLAFDFGEARGEADPPVPITYVSTEVLSEKPSPIPIRTENLPERVIGILNRAWGRIKRARNPEAYRQSIIQCELRLMRSNKLLPIKEVPQTQAMRRALADFAIPPKADPAIVEFDEEMTAFLASNCTSMEEFRKTRAA